MLPVKSNSTGKPKAKRLQLTVVTESLTCSKSVPNVTRKTDYERPRPIKIAQLLGQSENVKTAQKENVYMKLQPERLGTLSITKSAQLSKKQSGSSTSIQSTRPKKCVRRILNFSGASASCTKDINENKRIADELAHKKVFKPTRRSLLLLPNSIKEKHLRKCIDKVNRCSKISEVSKEIDQTCTDSTKTENKVTNELSNKLQNRQESVQSLNYLALKSTETNPGQEFITPKVFALTESKDLSEVVVHKVDQMFVENNLEISQSKLKNDTLVKPEQINDCIQNLCSNLQHTKLITSENDLNEKSESSEMIYVNKDNIIRLECHLKNLLREAEENMIKLKSTLTCVTRLLSASSKEIAFSNTELGKQNVIMVDKDIQVDTTSNFSQYSEEQLKTPVGCTSTFTVSNIELVNKNKLMENDENKNTDENVNTERTSDTGIDGSFLELEKQFNIAHTESARNCPIRLKTPKLAKFKQKRSLKEYMALKSNISFLETPDGKKFRSLCQLDNIDKPVSYISNKLLTDLHNLYSDSPDT